MDNKKVPKPMSGTYETMFKECKKDHKILRERPLYIYVWVCVCECVCV